ncbi:MAG: hypothetical protein RL557_947 [archaeon]|jgi:hypothetical protein
MGSWENIGTLNPAYAEVVTEGFLLAQGNLNLSFKDNPFGDRAPHFPSFQLLKVHSNRPYEITHGGKVSIRPWKDTRLLGDIVRDTRPGVYDEVSFFLVPYEVTLPSDYPGRVFATLDGFETMQGSRNRASLIYADRMGIEGEDVLTLSTIIPPQIPTHFNYWLSHQGALHGYNQKSKAGWEKIGRFDVKDPVNTTWKVAKELEKRFDTKMLSRGDNE